jgi:hypothetical protein
MVSGLDRAGSRGASTGADEEAEVPDSQNEQKEQQLRSQYSVRQVTNIQASWTEQERSQPGKFTLQLILDSGVEEYILDNDAEDLDVLLKLFARSDHTTFDTERKVLMFSNLSVK